MADPSTRPLIVLAEFEQPGKLAGPLVQAGFRTEIMDTADAALRFCGINQVDLVITRIVFRYGITGVDLAERLKALANVPAVLMITTYQSDRLRKIPGFPLPGVPVLRKPIVTDELVKMVMSIISERQRSAGRRPDSRQDEAGGGQHDRERVRKESRDSFGAHIP